MTDYISREAAIAETRKPRLTDAELRRRLAHIPSADVRPVVRGRWMPVMCAGNPNIQDRDEWYGALFVCDKCNWTMIGESNYCPNCGADMRETNDEKA